MSLLTFLKALKDIVKFYQFSARSQGAQIIMGNHFFQVCRVGWGGGGLEYFDIWDFCVSRFFYFSVGAKILSAENLPI